MAWQPDDRGHLEPVPAWDRRIWLVAVPLVLARGRRLPPRPGQRVRQLGRRPETSSRTPIFAAWAGRRCNGPGPPSGSASTSPWPGCSLRRSMPSGARPARLPPDQPASARRQCRRPVCPDRDRARPVPARFLPPAIRGRAPWGGAGDGPVRGAPAAGRGGGLGLVPAVSALRLVLHAGGAGLSPRRRGGAPAQWVWLASSFVLFAAASCPRRRR